MKVSLNWLQTFFDKPLPEAGAVIHLFEKHLAEVENLEEKNGDTVFDLNILPDRASFALGHERIAFELYQLIEGYEFKKRDPKFDFSSLPKVDAEIEDKTLCDRQIFVRIENIDNTIETPLEIKEKLEALGQRSISFIVDLTNFAMLDVRQPLHAFDALKINASISIRRAKSDEKVMTLDNREISLDEEMVVIADTDAPLDIAGIKGGKKAEVTKETSSIILSGSHFNAASIRKTSQKVAIKTDASKRFENDLSSRYVERGILDFLEILKKYQPEAQITAYTDLDYADRSDKNLEVSVQFISEKLGLEADAHKFVGILEKMRLGVSLESDMLKLVIPEYRKDLSIPEDIADEIGRIIGYDATLVVVPKFSSEDKIDSIFTISNKVRNFLTEKGFSEVYTYSLSNKGEIEIQNPLASDKSFMRSNLTDGISEALSKNIYYADLLGLAKIKIFEIGKIFRKEGEYNSLCIGIASKKSVKSDVMATEIEDIQMNLLAHLIGYEDVDDLSMDINISDMGKPFTRVHSDGSATLEINLDLLISELPGTQFEELKNRATGVRYKGVSEFPFTSRDVAVFVPGPKGSGDEVLALIAQEAGELLVRTDLFDVFEKKNKETQEVEKTSYAFRLVFQSFEKTLTDEEVNPIMNKIYEALKERSWEIR